ncbi:hypothetical protein [Streptomyces mangrovi]|uniref:hypothetical protein n=1 Tax=Streptomyces mangrovi TaxID=1206892 RepID=UPI00399CECB0
MAGIGFVKVTCVSMVGEACGSELVLREDLSKKIATVDGARAKHGATDGFAVYSCAIEVNLAGTVRG